MSSTLRSLKLALAEKTNPMDVTMSMMQNFKVCGYDPDHEQEL